MNRRKVGLIVVVLVTAGFVTYVVLDEEGRARAQRAHTIGTLADSVRQSFFREQGIPLVEMSSDFQYWICMNHVANRLRSRVARARDLTEVEAFIGVWEEMVDRCALRFPADEQLTSESAAVAKQMAREFVESRLLRDRAIKDFDTWRTFAIIGAAAIGDSIDSTYDAWVARGR